MKTTTLMGGLMQVTNVVGPSEQANERQTF